MSDKINFSLTSYIFGVVSIVTAFFTPLLGLVFGIIGLVQSNKEKTKVSKSARKLNIIGIIVSVVLFTITIIVLMKSGNLPNLPI